MRKFFKCLNNIFYGAFVRSNVINVNMIHYTLCHLWYMYHASNLTFFLGKLPIDKFFF